MRTCEACGRDFAGRKTDCPFCGFNTARRGGPRSKRSLAAESQRRQEEAELQRELAELSEDEQRWWLAMEEHKSDGSTFSTKTTLRSGASRAASVNNP